MLKNEPSLTSMRQMVLEMFYFKVRNLGKIRTSPFCRFSASFSHKYHIIDLALQDKVKIKAQYLRSLLFDLFKTLQAVRT